MRITQLLTLLAANTLVSTFTLGQGHTAGYDLIVSQHPTLVDPVAVIEVWAWTDFSCTLGTPFNAGGFWNLHLSHPVVSEASGAIQVTCKMDDDIPERGSYPYCQFGLLGSPRAYGHSVQEFTLTQTIVGGDASHYTVHLDNPLHIMDISMRLDDLMPLDLVVTTFDRDRQDACLQGVVVSQLTRATTIIEGQTTIRVSGGSCRADFDADGSLTIFDFLAFQNAFDAGDLAADFDGDGELTLFDFLAFQNEFDAGCE